MAVVPPNVVEFRVRDRIDNSRKIEDGKIEAIVQKILPVFNLNVESKGQRQTGEIAGRGAISN
ncbi:MAG: hypothetical protein J7647_12415 [Cyanobacteria bacterium SBLK]|nr:hypothetical protein [Cyanobacteria bacterium SBLK]